MIRKQELRRRLGYTGFAHLLQVNEGDPSCWWLALITMGRETCHYSLKTLKFSSKQPSSL